MNNARRSKIAEVVTSLNSLSMKIDRIMDEEQSGLDNIPENLQGTERYQKSEEAVSALEDAMNSLEECIEHLETAAE